MTLGLMTLRLMSYDQLKLSVYPLYFSQSQSKDGLYSSYDEPYPSYDEPYPSYDEPYPSYSVINKEGHKVLGYKTIKKCDFDATNKFIQSKSMGYFVIFVICLIISNIISIVMYIKKCIKLAKSVSFLRNFSFLG